MNIESIRFVEPKTFDIAKAPAFSWTAGPGSLGFSARIMHGLGVVFSRDAKTHVIVPFNQIHEIKVTGDLPQPREGKAENKADQPQRV
jgi:hypothetical protein